MLDQRFRRSFGAKCEAKDPETNLARARIPALWAAVMSCPPVYILTDSQKF